MPSGRPGVPASSLAGPLPTLTPAQLRRRGAAPRPVALRLPVLHPMLVDGTLLLWVERPAPPGGWTGTGSARWSPSWRPAHPGALPPDHLRALLRSAGAPAAEPAQDEVHAAVLPTADRSPLPSPAAGGPADGAAPGEPWLVPVLRIPAEHLPDWLRPFRPGSGLRLGPEWGALWRAAAVVRHTVRRGAVVPVLEVAARTPPRWRVIPGREEHRALAEVARGLPAPAAGGAAPAAALDALVQGYADALVRKALRDDTALARWRRGRSASAPARRWLASVLDPAAGVPPPLPAPFHGWAADPAGLEDAGRLVLQVHEPPTGPEASAPWSVSVYLRVPREPDVLLPPSAVREEVRHYAPDGPLVGGLAEASRQLWALHRAFRRAANVFPALGTQGGPHDGDAPDEIELAPAQAWELFQRGRSRLEAAGVELLVPAWWAQAPRPTARLRLTRSAGGGLFAADQLVRFDWQVAIGGEELAPEEFERLVARRSPFVRLRGGWAVLPPEAAEALAARWRTGGAHGEVGLGTALLMAVQAEARGGPAEQAGEAHGVRLDADPAVLEQMRQLCGPPVAMPEPPGFRGTLRPYQRLGLGWLARRADLGLGGILADDMGLGKTIQVLALVAHRRTLGRTGPTLIAAPTSVVANWAAEAGRFAPDLRVVTHHGPGRARGHELARQAAGADLVLTSYALLLRDVAALAAIRWDGIVLDEAQNIKNAGSKQAEAARRLPGRYRLALTGTPVENALSDLWSIFQFVQPGYLGSARNFQRRLAGRIEHGRDAEATATLRRLIAPLVLRRTKREPGVADELPERIESIEQCALTREQAALYEAVTRELLQRIEESAGMGRRAVILLALLRLKQICDHPALYAGDGRVLDGGSGKLERLEILLDEVLAEGEAALIFTQFAAWARLLTSHLRRRVGPDVPVLLLEGATPAVERERRVRAFQATAGPAVFVLSLKAGGAGLNLTAARHVFHYDRWWNPAVEQQATDRAHRIGQSATVHVHKLLCPGTLEERIDELIRRKEGLALDVLGGRGEAWLTELSDAEIRNVLTLRRAALAE